VRKYYIIFIITIQLLTIAGIINNILTRKSAQKVLGSNAVATPDESGLVKAENQKFKYYYKLEPSQIITEKKYWDNTTTEITVNADGLNDRFNYEVNKPANTFRIITLGDSFTYGRYINTKDNWTEKLEDLLNNKGSCSGNINYEVINLGMPGFDVPYIIERFKDYGLKYKPDLIIWFESGTGFLRNREKSEPYIQNCYNEIKFQKSNQSGGKDLADCWFKAYTNIEATELLEVARKRLTEWMEEFLTTRGDIPVLITSSKAIEPQHKEAINTIVGQHLESYYTDSITQVNEGSGTALYDTHPNEKGHKMIANDMYKYITSNKKLGVSCTD
jgi:lysophospholipase L1-like esterase